MNREPPFLPYGRHLIEEDDVAAVTAVLRGEALTGGPAVAAFEAALKNATRAGHAVVCGNGTEALHLAVLAAGVGPGDWVICPAMTFLATANAARFAGAEVVFADVEPDTGLITAGSAAAAAARAGGPVKAVLPVDFAGQTGDWAALSALARQRGWAVIEDACHAAGSRYDFAPGISGAVGDGRWADFTIFSFHPVKTVAMGEGGAITTNDAALAARMASLRNHGTVRTAEGFTETAQAFGPDGRPHPWYYEMQDLGFNYRACDLQCALGLSQLAKLERFAARRRHLAALYDAQLAALAPRVRPLARTPGVVAAWHLYAVLIEFEAFGLSRDTVMARLAAAGIGSQVHYIPVPWQPYYRRRYGETALPGAARYYARTLSLPLYPGMADGDVDRVAGALEEALMP
ncbi:MAG: UDP-4-amino-4,6-dideoxy-N-acetyl-beta-L-altrosamine transaminase [Rhodospirillaceae bacterium]